MERYVWWAGHQGGKDELRFVSTAAGVPFAMTAGMRMKRMLFAHSSALIPIIPVSIQSSVIADYIITCTHQLFFSGHMQHALSIYSLYTSTSLLSGAIPVTRAAFGAGSGPIFLDNLLCAGREASLLDCLGATIGIQSCAHTQDAGVYCSRKFSLFLRSCICMCDVLTTILLGSRPLQGRIYPAGRWHG